MILLFSTIALSFVYIFLNVILVIIRNYRSHNFFKLKMPNLPCLPSPNLIDGNASKVAGRSKNWKIIDKLHKEYGNSFGYYMCNQPWVSTKDLDLIKLIEIDEGDKHLNRLRFGLPFKEFDNSLFQVQDQDWKRVRKAVAPALTNHKVRSEEVTSDIKQVLSRFCEALKMKINDSKLSIGENSDIIDFNNIIRRFTLSVIFLITYKQDKVIDFYNEEDEWVKSIDEGGDAATSIYARLCFVFPFFKPICENLAPYLSTTGKTVDKIKGFIVKATEMNKLARKYQNLRKQQTLNSSTAAAASDRKQLKGLPQKFDLNLNEINEKLFLKQNNDNYKINSFINQEEEDMELSGLFKRRLIDTIIDAYLEKKLNHEEYLNSAFILLIAGFQTTSDTITCLIFHLLHQPEIQEKLRKTLLNEGIDADYVKWCILEAIRWHPALPLGTGRVLSDDVHLNGITYPKGTFIMPSTYSIHHDSNIWPEADKFKPDRWKDESKFHKAAFMGFGLGPRNCVGLKLAMHEIKLVLEMLLTNFRLEKCTETSDEFDFISPGMVFTTITKQIKGKIVPL